MAREPVRPVRRRVLLGSILLIVLTLAGAIEAVEELRHPPTGGEPPTSAVDADPREQPTCEDREAQPGRRRIAYGSTLSSFEVNSNALYDCPAAWDGRAVRYTGEVVGPVLRRDDHAWVQLNDDVYSGPRGPLPAHRDYQGGNGGVGVRIPLELANQIEWIGGGQSNGDVLEVRGRFHRVLDETRDAAVIVAQSGALVQRGKPFVDPTLPDRAWAAWIVAAVAAVLATAERVVARRRR